MELLAVDRARAAARDSAARDGAALGSTFGYLPEPQRELAAPAPPAGTIEIVTRASSLDYSDSWSGFKLTPEQMTWILRLADWGSPLQLFDMYESTVLADGHTRGLYEQRLDEVRVDWSWRAGDARPGSQQAAEELDAATQQIDMEGAIEFLALAPFFGCSYVECRVGDARGRPAGPRRAGVRAAPAVHVRPAVAALPDERDEPVPGRPDRAATGQLVAARGDPSVAAPGPGRDPAHRRVVGAVQAHVGAGLADLRREVRDPADHRASPATTTTRPRARRSAPRSTRSAPRAARFSGARRRSRC